MTSKEQFNFMGQPLPGTRSCGGVDGKLGCVNQESRRASRGRRPLWQAQGWSEGASRQWRRMPHEKDTSVGGDDNSSGLRRYVTFDGGRGDHEIHHRGWWLWG